MNKTLIIYDNDGYIIQQITGFYRVPVGIPYIEIEIPEGKFINGIDVENNKVIFEDIPKSENEILKDKIDILHAENNRLKEVEKEQDKMIIDNSYKMTMIEANLGGI